MLLGIKPRYQVSAAIILTAIGLLPVTSFAKSKPITTTDLLQTLRKGEPWDRSVFAATKAVMFEQALSGGTDATSISKITLSYFTTADCSGTGQGNDTGSVPNPSYTTPNGTSYTISVGPPGFGLVAASVWNVGNAKLGISDANMANIQSIAVTFKSTNNNTPQSNFSGSSFACVPVTCTAGPGGQCTSASGTQSFQLKTTAAIGDPADGGVIGCMNGGLNNLVVPASDSGEIKWSDLGTTTNAMSTTDGATNTTTIVNCLTNGMGVCVGGETVNSYAAGICSTYTTTGGFTTGWFLPAGNSLTASGQLNCLYTNRVAIGGFETDDMRNPYYWSSTDNDSNTAWAQDFSRDEDEGASDKNFTFRVRCARAFIP